MWEYLTFFLSFSFCHLVQSGKVKVHPSDCLLHLCCEYHVLAPSLRLGNHLCIYRVFFTQAIGELLNSLDLRNRGVALYLEKLYLSIVA